MITGFILAASAGAGAHATNGKHARENVTERRNWEDSDAYGHFKPTSLSKWQDWYPSLYSAPDSQRYAVGSMCSLSHECTP